MTKYRYFDDFSQIWYLIDLDNEYTYKMVKCGSCNGTGVMDNYIMCRDCQGKGHRYVEWFHYILLPYDHKGDKVY